MTAPVTASSVAPRYRCRPQKERHEVEDPVHCYPKAPAHEHQQRDVIDNAEVDPGSDADRAQGVGGQVQNTLGPDNRGEGRPVHQTHPPAGCC